MKYNFTYTYMAPIIVMYYYVLSNFLFFASISHINQKVFNLYGDIKYIRVYILIYLHINILDYRYSLKPL
jgi:MFS superfamily sulfate permease-like transporter